MRLTTIGYIKFFSGTIKLLSESEGLPGVKLGDVNQVDNCVSISLVWTGPTEDTVYMRYIFTMTISPLMSTNEHKLIEMISDLLRERVLEFVNYVKERV